MNKRAISILISLFLSVLTIAGQDLQFEQLSVKEGLPYNQITELAQDKLGFLWIGTEDGLFRYDGRTFREFRHITKDTTSLSNNDIRSLFVDKSGRLWVGTNMGLNLYYPEEERFKRFINYDSESFLADNYILDVLVDGFNQVWYCTYNGLYLMDPDFQTIRHFLPEPDNQFSIPDIVVWEVFEDFKGRLWFGTNNGLAIYKNDGTFNFSCCKPDYENNSGLKTDKVWAFCQQPDSTIWFGSYDGLFRIDETNGKLNFTQFCYNPDDENSLSYNFIESLTSGSGNTFYACTWNGGLNEVKIIDGTPMFNHYNATPAKPNSISHNNVTSCLIDQSGMLWVGTEAGLNKSSLKGQKCITISGNHYPEKPEGYMHVNAILSDNNMNLWIGTEGGGLLFFPKNKLENSDFTFTTLLSNPGSWLSHNNIYGLFEDNKGEIWISTYNGLNRVRFNQKGQVEWWQAYDTGDGLPHGYCYGIIQENDTVYWIATYGELSMMTVDPDNSEHVSFKNFDMDEKRNDALVNSMVYSMCFDRFGQLWLGTFGGLSKLISTEDEGIFENYIYNINDNNAISGSQVGTLFCDSKGRMWAGTESGLCFFNQKSANEKVTFKTFGIESGLPNDDIKAIMEDDQGYLWLSTNRGIAVFNPDEALAGNKPLVNTYNLNDGLQGNVFNHRSATKDKTGRLYFGGIEGFSIINPENIPVNTIPPEIVLTDFKLFNKSVSPSDSSRSVLAKSINFTDTIKLFYWQNNFTLEFAALDFIKPEKNQYAYYLENVDNGWIYSDNRNFATYSRIPPGEYMFRAKGTNNDGVWSVSSAEILIISLPPIWKKWWAYIIYIIIFLSGILLFIRLRIKAGMREIEKEKAIEMARYEERDFLRRKNAADFHDELGHRLTKISLFLELANREKSIKPTLKNYLNKVKENTTGLSEGIRDLIWTIDPKNDNLYEILARLHDFGNQLFEFSDITFRANGISQLLKKYEVKAEARKHILLLFKEAMNNSLKYSQANNTTFNISNDNGNIEIYFSDNGIGFELNEVKKGYGLKNITERAEKAGAHISISSARQKGTIIKMKLKLEK